MIKFEQSGKTEDRQAKLKPDPQLVAEVVQKDLAGKDSVFEYFFLPVFLHDPDDPEDLVSTRLTVCL